MSRESCLSFLPVRHCSGCFPIHLPVCLRCLLFELLSSVRLGNMLGQVSLLPIFQAHSPFPPFPVFPNLGQPRACTVFPLTFSSYPFPFLALLFPFSLQSAHIPILLLRILPPFPSSSFFTYLPLSIVFILCQPSFSCPYFLDFPSFLPYSTQPGLAYLSGSFSFPYQVLLHQYLGLFYLFSLITQIPNFIDYRAYLGPLQLSHLFLGYPSFWPCFPALQPHSL